jgi:hypothetical protein
MAHEQSTCARAAVAVWVLTTSAVSAIAQDLMQPNAIHDASVSVHIDATAPHGGVASTVREAALAPPNGAPVVTTSAGAVWGTKLPASGGVEVNQFLGIPFATAER